MSAEGGTKAVVAALTANLFIAATKFGAWLLTRSSSMLAEAIHSLADSGNQILLLLGGRAAKRRPDQEHPFGFGRERYVLAFIVSIVLFSVGGLFALYEAYHKYHEVREGHPNELLESQWWWVPVAILVAAMVAEGLSFRTAVREANKSRGTKSLVAYVRSAKAPELPVILLEDFAALLGLTFALFGVGLTLLTDNAYFDVIGTALIGLLLVGVAVVLGIEIHSLLVGEAADPEVESAITAALVGVDGVDGVIHMKTLHTGPEEILVAAKIAVSPTESAADVAAAIDRAEERIRATEPMVTSLYLEPDIYSENYVPAPRPERPAAPSH